MKAALSFRALCVIASVTLGVFTVLPDCGKDEPVSNKPNAVASKTGKGSSSNTNSAPPSPGMAEKGQLSPTEFYSALPDMSSLPTEQLKNLAEIGVAQAQYELGARFLRTNDLKAAVVWFEKAAIQNHAHACFKLSFYCGDSVKALQWARKGAELGDAACQQWLAIQLLGGEESENTPEALRWMEKAAAQGHRMAQTNLAHIYFQGTLVPKNLTNAVKYYTMAAEQGDTDSQVRLADIHYDNRDYKESAKWYRVAADNGNQYAQFNLGVIFEYGQGVDKSPGAAATWYRKAAEQGFASAQGNLGGLYADGEGVLQDYAEAARWLRKAAEQGNSHGQRALGALFANGQGVPQDYVEAYKWSNLAAAQGDNWAVTNRINITRFMTRDQIAEGQRRSAAFVAKKEKAPTWEETTPFDPSQPFQSTPRASGTGFLITDDGYLLTSYHVVTNAASIRVSVGDKSHPATLAKADKVNDVALLKISGTFKSLPIAASRSVKLGDSVFTLGFPNTDIQGTEPKLTRGEISSLAGIQDDPRHFQASVAVQPGNSGGALVNLSGEVVGIVESRLNDLTTLAITGSLPQNVNYAIKSAFVTAFLETIPEVTAKLKPARPAKERPFSEVVEEVRSSVVLIWVY